MRDRWEQAPPRGAARRVDPCRVPAPVHALAPVARHDRSSGRPTRSTCAPTCGPRRRGRCPNDVVTEASADCRRSRADRRQAGRTDATHTRPAEAPGATTTSTAGGCGPGPGPGQAMRRPDGARRYCTRDRSKRLGGRARAVRRRPPQPASTPTAAGSTGPEDSRQPHHLRRYDGVVLAHSVHRHDLSTPMPHYRFPGSCRATAGAVTARNWLRARTTTGAACAWSSAR